MAGRAFTGKPVGFVCAAGGRSSYMAVLGLANSLMLDFRCLIVPRFVASVIATIALTIYASTAPDLTATLGLAWDAGAVTSGYDGGGRPIAEAVMYNAATDEIGAEPVSGLDELIFDVTVCPTGHWLFADASGGIRVYDGDGVQLTQDILDIGLPPVGGGMVCY